MEAIRVLIADDQADEVGAHFLEAFAQHPELIGSDYVHLGMELQTRHAVPQVDAQLVTPARQSLRAPVEVELAVVAVELIAAASRA